MNRQALLRLAPLSAMFFVVCHSNSCRARGARLKASAEHQSLSHTSRAPHEHGP